MGGAYWNHTMCTSTRITPEEVSGQDVVCDHTHHQPTLSVNTTPAELRAIQELKVMTSDHVARALLAYGSDELRKESDRLYDCSENIQLRHNGTVATYARCKRRLCALCSSIEASKWHNDLTKAMDHLDYDMADEIVQHAQLGLFFFIFLLLTACKHTYM